MYPGMAAARPRPRAPFLVRLFRASRLVVATAAVVILGALAVHLGCQNKSPPPAPQPVEVVAPDVRVRIVQDATSVKLTATAAAQPATVRVGAEGARLLAFPAKTPIVVTLADDGWHVGSESLGTGDLTIAPAPVGTLAVDGRAYRGAYRLVPTKAAGKGGPPAAGGSFSGSGSFDVVNHLSVDDYLRGVLSAELYPEFHVEAYKAQAVIARTYAIFVARTTPDGRHWDLHADTRSQAYGGIRTETAKALEAVAATAGTVVAYGKPGDVRIFKAYYSSCCGGATLSNADVFGEAAAEPFTEKSVGRRCDITAGRYKAQFDWGPVTVSRDELTRRFRLWGRRAGHPLKNVDVVRKVEVFRANAAGRPTAFAVEDAKGTKYVIQAEQFRLAVNTDAPDASKLPSSFVAPAVDGSVVRFTGHGFGHGVGMCQWCLEAQARQGVGYEQIVRDAYKGAVLVKGY
jgi:stage II sporulation protein D